jgi:YD repeat-containing protein
MVMANIKSLKHYKQYAPDEENVLLYHHLLDANGNKLKEQTYAPDGELIEEKEYRYNEKGQLAEVKSHFVADEVIEIIQYEYDAEGKITKTHKRYGEQGDADTTNYSYNEAGKLVEKRCENNDGEIEHSELWKYSGDLLMETNVKDGEGKILEYSKFSYTKEGILSEELKYNPETEQELKILYDILLPGKTPDTTIYNKAGNIIQRTRHTFNEKQLLVKEITESVSNGIQKFTSEFQYSENDLLLESKIVDKNDNLISKIRYKYNEFNLPCEELHFEKTSSGDENLESRIIFEYEYY